MHYQRALEFVPAAGGGPRERFETMLGLVTAFVRAGKRDEAWSVACQAAGLARELHDPELLANAALWAEEVWVAAAEPHRPTIELLEEALEALPAREELAELRARLLASLSVHAYYVDELSASDARTEEAVSIARRLKDRRLLGHALHARRFALRVRPIACELDHLVVQPQTLR